MKTSQCLWCEQHFTFEKNDTEHLAFCQAQLNWPIAEFDDNTGKSYIVHPKYPSIFFERITTINWGGLMSGRPYTYGRAMAIAQLMRDMRRPILKEIVAKNKAWYDELVKRRDESGLNYQVLGPHGPTTVYLYGEDLFTSYSDTIDWVPKLSKLTKYGRHAHYLTAEQIAVETDNREQFPLYYSDILGKKLYIEPIEGWPTEEEIAAEIAASAERERNWKGGLSANDFTAMARLLG